MMTRTLLTAATLALGLGMTAPAFAYTTPEEALEDGNFSVQYYEKPPTAREAAQRQQEQQERSAAQRAAQQEALFADDEEELMRAAAPDGMAQSDWEALLNAIRNLDDGSTDARDARLLERINAQQAAQLHALTTQETLHSGAPLSETGPATMAGVLLLLGTALLVIRKAKSL